MVRPVTCEPAPIVEEPYAVSEPRLKMFLVVPVMSPPRLKLLMVPALMVLAFSVVEVAVPKKPVVAESAVVDAYASCEVEEAKSPVRNHAGVVVAFVEVEKVVSSV